MEFSLHISRILHEDHQSTIEAMESLETMISGRAASRPPDTSDPKTRAALREIATMVKAEIRDHFAFEENELFPRLAEFGDIAIGEHLTEEHALLLPVGQNLAALAAAAGAQGFTDASWAEFKAIGADLAERMFTHIQKEEMGMLPLLEDVIDSETDFELAERYQRTA
jgi:iron-sulfur cluster repair protein YtfE (RIC family)